MSGTVPTNLIDPALKPDIPQLIPAPLQFITISDPLDIKHRKNQKKIRRHARQSTTRRNLRKNRPTSWNFEVSPAEQVVASTVDSTDTTTVYPQGHSTFLQQHLGTHSVVLSLDPSLQDFGAPGFHEVERPLGAGIGLNPMQNLPLAQADRQSSLLVEYCMH
jgi:hypothetical protein